MTHQDGRSGGIPVTVYTPESRLRRPKALLQEIWTDLQTSRELAWQLFQRQLGTRYRQTALGPLWVLITPIFTALVVTILKGANGFSVAPGAILPVPINVFFASIIWEFFSKSVRLPLQAMRESLAILRTMRVSVEGFLMAKVGELFFEQSVQFFVLGIVLLVLPLLVPSISFSISLSGVVMAIALLAIMMILGMGIGFFVVPLGSLYLDVNQALPMILRLWFFLTPVIYGIDVPKDSPYYFLLSLNPVPPLLQGVMDVSLGQPLAQGWTIVVIGLLACVLFMLGWLVYRISIPLLVER